MEGFDIGRRGRRSGPTTPRKGKQNEERASGGANGSSKGGSRGKAKRSAEESDNTQASKRRRSDEQQSALKELPEEFQRLDSIFTHLNTVYTFIHVQRQIVCTYESLRPAVEKSCGPGYEFSLQVLAKIRAIMGTMLHIYWTERSSLVEGSITELKDPSDSEGYVLVIEFRDSRRVHIAQKILGIDRKTRQLLTRAPSLVEQAEASHANQDIVKRIEHRQHAFRESLLAFHRSAVEKEEDPIQKLAEASLTMIPTSPGYNDVTPEVERPPVPTERPESLDKLLEEITKETWYAGQFVKDGRRTVVGRESKFAPLDNDLSSELWDGLRSAKNITQLYSHQSKALNELDRGKHVIVATATSSGKSLIYQLPVLRGLEQDPALRAMFIFPTKALAQDQKRSLLGILGQCHTLLQWVRVDTFDGDTPMKGETRADIRDNAHVIFTNPDMLHVTILPQHRQWREFLSRLNHYFTDTMGSHTAMIMRRLRRLCHLHGNNDVQFVSCSATIQNPVEFMQTFFGLKEVSLISDEDDGSPCGQKHLVIWNPPPQNPHRVEAGRMNSVGEAVKLMIHLLSMGVRTICFAKVRRSCELVYKQLAQDLRAVAPELLSQVMSYRGGYMAEERRRIEKELFSGELMGVIATNALELGVDIGTLDAVIHVGFPFYMSSYRQQSGRAGRREQDSISILITEGDNPMDQYFARNPNELFDAPLESVVIDVSNELILEAHLQCAAAEVPIDFERDRHFFDVPPNEDSLETDGDVMQTILNTFLMKQEETNLYFPHLKYEGRPARKVNIRSINDASYRVIDVTRNIDLEDIEASRAPYTLYEGSIVIHQGRSYMVFEVNTELMFAKVRPANVDYITSHRKYTNVDPIQTVDVLSLSNPADSDPNAPSLNVFFGKVKEQTNIFGYFKKNPLTKQVIEEVTGLESPPLVQLTWGFWLDVPQSTVDELRAAQIDVEFAVHAASHAILTLLPVYVRIPSSGDTDMATDCKTPSARRYRPPRITVYNSEGKSNMAYKAFKYIRELILRAKRAIESCNCEIGCPACIQMEGCSHANSALNKIGGLIILKALSVIIDGS
ncbi:hypothetical protein BJ742DRAFT_828857 [Cladochytrium replicatum]|nr:hypothetical protein BJ742DRAFT_828857 [Cladochytrium replicatum]